MILFSGTTSKTIVWVWDQAATIKCNLDSLRNILSNFRDFILLGGSWKGKTITGSCFISLLYRPFRRKRWLLSMYCTFVRQRIRFAWWCGTIQEWNQKVFKLLYFNIMFPSVFFFFFFHVVFFFHGFSTKRIFLIHSFHGICEKRFNTIYINPFAAKPVFGRCFFSPV